MRDKRLTILMCTRDGAEHLPAQLGSFLDQTHRNWRLSVSDDGSRDGTRALLDEWAGRNPDAGLTLHRGPEAGRSAPNYLGLLARTRPEDGFLAFSDQDDIWLPAKLERACACLAALPDPSAPAVYSARSLHLRPGHAWPVPSTRFRRRPGFGNALVQNVLSGHALVVNPSAAEILRASVPAALAEDVPFHDWWVYLIAAGAGMRIVLDDRPLLLYRQHAANELGGNRGLRAGLARLGAIRDGRFAGWIDRNLVALGRCDALLRPEALALRDEFVDWRRQGWMRVVRGPRRLGLYRQSHAGDAALEIAGRAGLL